MNKTTSEQWKAITKYKTFEFDGKYEISSWGHIRNADTKKPLATYDNKRGNGYLKTKIYDTQGKRRILYIHTLVALSFLNSAPGEKLEVNHKDGNSKNNSFTNLEWITHAENVRECYRLRRMV